jgi:predicted amidophosphoribosyltransferase
VTVEDLLSVYRIDETIALPPPRAIGIIDDVLTAGTHFRAMDTVLRARFPEVPITGMFIARRVFPSAADDFDIVL